MMRRIRVLVACEFSGRVREVFFHDSNFSFRKSGEWWLEGYFPHLEV